MKKKTEFFRKSAIVISAAALSLGAAGCNAVKGLGQDIESVGQTGEEAIN